MNIRADQDPIRLQLLQQALLDTAERMLGPRDSSFQLLPPAFADTGPFIRVSSNPNTVRSELSPNAKGYWPTTVFELAHETVHLMNPRTGYTNHFEEGVAVAFQLQIAPAFSGIEMPIALASYRRAHELVLQLGEPALGAAAKVRKHVGAMSAVTSTQLAELFPQATDALLGDLASECVPR